MSDLTPEEFRSLTMNFPLFRSVNEDEDEDKFPLPPPPVLCRSENVLCRSENVDFEFEQSDFDYFIRHAKSESEIVIPEFVIPKPKLVRMDSDVYRHHPHPPLVRSVAYTPEPFIKLSVGYKTGILWTIIQFRYICRLKHAFSILKKC